MATFTSFQNILPDPNNRISYAGDSNASNAGSALGQGYASVQLSSEQKTLKDRTNSGRVLARAVAAHKWKIAIKYNPMTQIQFDPIYAFLLHRRGAINPFFISLPQYRTPRDSNFASFSASNVIDTSGTTAAGATSILTNTSGYNNNSNGTPRPGDLFTVTDSADSNHSKAYMVTRVETDTDRLSSTGVTGNTQLQIHFTPGLSKSVSSGADLIFHNPLIRVILTVDIQQYSLKVINLYEYSLSLEEAQ